MHPILFVVPFPYVTMRLGAALGLVALASVAVAVLGRMSRAADLVRAGAVAAIAAGGLAVAFGAYVLPLGPLPIYAHGLLLAASLAAGLVHARCSARRRGIRDEAFARVVAWAAIAAFVGGRLAYVLENPGAVERAADVLAVSRGGLTLWGAVAGGFVAAWAVLARARLAPAPFADAIAPGCALAIGGGRLGCYLFGCDFGVPMGPKAPRLLAPLGTFPRWDDSEHLGAGSPAWLAQRAAGLIDAEATWSLPVHPVQLYEAVLALVIVALTVVLAPRKPFDGALAALVALVYGAGRFVLELLRGDPERARFGPDVPVLVALGLVAVALLAVWATGPGRPPVSRRQWREPALVLATAAVSVALARLIVGADADPLSSSQWLVLAAFAGLAWRWWRRPPRPWSTGNEPAPSA